MKIRLSKALLKFAVYGLVSFGTLCSSYTFQKNKIPEDDNEVPKIVNIVNFIRLLEPRDANITEEVLYQTVVKQVDIIKKYKLKADLFITI